MIYREAFALGATVALLMAGSSGDAFQSPPLQGTEWRLTHLGEKALTVSDAQTAPSLTLQRTSSRFSGSGGCNRITGAYRAKAASITFGPVAGTRMACPGGMDTEAAFVGALARVKTWRIAERVLEFLDGSGQLLARFEAPVAAPAGFVNRVWRVDKSSAVAPGTLYVFLSDGTLLVASANTKPLVGAWKYESRALTMIEEGVSYRVDILTLNEARFTIRSHHPGGSVDIALVPTLAPGSK